MTRVLIIGGGPAGLFAAEELHKSGVTDIVILDSGKPAEVRKCPLTSACNCSPCDILEGSGGSGGVSDGKMPFSLTRGTQLEKVFHESDEPLLKYVEETLYEFGVEGHRYEPSDKTVETGSRLEFSTYPLLHIGSDGVQKFSEVFSQHISELPGVELRRQTRALSLLWEGNRVVGASVRQLKDGHVEPYDIRADHVIVAVGLWGVGWLEDQLVPHGVEFLTGPAGFGMRVETPESVMAPLFDQFYDFKVMGEYEGMTLRSFCCNRYGHIMPEYHKHLNIRNVNGHSYLDPSRRSNSSNFSLQAKVGLEQTSDPQSFVRSVSRAVNALSNGYQARQRISDFLEGRPTDVQVTGCSTVTYPQARVVNIASALPDFLYKAFCDYLRDLDKMIPGLVDSGWLYAPEVKYHAKKLPIDRDTWKLKGIEGAYILGDSTGLTGSYVSAALTGLIAARSIANIVLEEAHHA